MPKFRNKRTQYKVAVNDVNIRGVPEILGILKLLFTSIIEDVTKKANKNDLFRLTITTPELDFPISIKFMKKSGLTVEVVLSEIERVLQSFEQFVKTWEA